MILFRFGLVTVTYIRKIPRLIFEKKSNEIECEFSIQLAAIFRGLSVSSIFLRKLDPGKSDLSKITM